MLSQIWRALVKASGAKVFSLSGATGENVTTVLRAMRDRIAPAIAEEAAANPAAPWRP